MRKALFVIFWMSATTSFSQSYKLIPDSCTFCLFLTSTGGNSWYQNGYGINPENDTLFLGNTYTKISESVIYRQPFAIRQVGNQLKGVVPDSLNEVLIMDFGAAVGDTIFNLYSEGFLYHAKVVSKDSVLVNGGVYHKSMNVQACRIFLNGSWQDYSWPITWNERALCSSDGGVLFNVPYDLYVISVPYAYPAYCTTDTLYTNPDEVSCENCIAQTNSMDEAQQINFDVYPNPTSDKLTISFSSVGPKEITILNSVGQVFIQTSSEVLEQEFDLQDLSPGIYFITVHNEDVVSTKKFIKN